MSDSWANSGLDLHLEVAGTGVRAALENELRTAVTSGRLVPGTLLPSSRALARDLGLARNTVADAYGQLVAEGWLAARQGAGTRVAEVSGVGEMMTTEVTPASAPPGFAPAGCGPPGSGPPGSGPPGSGPPGSGPPGFDLRPGAPDLSRFPRAAWLSALRRALQAAPYEALGYGDGRGHARLRRELAAYLARARGVRGDPERVVICGGFSQALTILCEVLLARGARTVATEAYGHQAHRKLITEAGLEPSVLPVDGGGAVVESLGNAGAVLLTPAHQFPLGVPLTPARRLAAANWAQSSGGFVIEDDYDGEFRFDRQAVGAMQALAPEQIIYAGTSSKTLAPGLRLAWLMLPGGLVDEVVALKTRHDRLTGVMDQLALTELIANGGYDRHVRRLRLSYQRRRGRTVAALAAAAPTVEVAGVAAGLHLLAQLPAEMLEEDVTARACGAGLALSGLREFSVSPGEHPPALVIGYGTPPDHAFTGAVARLCASLSP